MRFAPMRVSGMVQLHCTGQIHDLSLSKKDATLPKARRSPGWAAASSVWISDGYGVAPVGARFGVNGLGLGGTVKPVPHTLHDVELTDPVHGPANRHPDRVRPQGVLIAAKVLEIEGGMVSHPARARSVPSVTARMIVVLWWKRGHEHRRLPFQKLKAREVSGAGAGPAIEPGRNRNRMTITRLTTASALPIGQGQGFREHRWSSGESTANPLAKKVIGHDADPAIDPGPLERCAAATTGVPCRCVRLAVHG